MHLRVGLHVLLRGCGAFRGFSGFVIRPREQKLELLDALVHVRQLRLRLRGSCLGRLRACRRGVVLLLELLDGEGDFDVDVVFQLLIRSLDRVELRAGVRELGLDLDDGGVGGGPRLGQRGVEFGLGRGHLLPRLREDRVDVLELLLELRGFGLGLDEGCLGHLGVLLGHLGVLLGSLGVLLGSLGVLLGSLGLLGRPLGGARRLLRFLHRVRQLGGVRVRRRDRRLGPRALLLDGPRRPLLRGDELGLSLLRRLFQRGGGGSLRLDPRGVGRRGGFRLDATLHLGVRRSELVELPRGRVRAFVGGGDVADGSRLGRLERLRHLRRELFRELGLGLRRRVRRRLFRLRRPCRRG